MSDFLDINDTLIQEESLTAIALSTFGNSIDLELIRRRDDFDLIGILRRIVREVVKTSFVEVFEVGEILGIALSHILPLLLDYALSNKFIVFNVV